MNRHAIELVLVTLLLSSCAPASRQPQSSLEEFLGVLNSVPSDQGISDKAQEQLLQLLRKAPEGDDRALALIFLATHSLAKQAFSYPLLQQSHKLAILPKSQVGISTRLLLARLWLLYEMPWKAEELLQSDSHSDALVSLRTHAKGTEFQRQIISKLLSFMCDADKSGITAIPRVDGDHDARAASNSLQACDLVLQPAAMFAIATSDEEDFRRYATILASEQGATEEPQFQGSPWNRILFAPTYASHIGAILGQIKEGDPNIAERAKAFQATKEAVGAAKIDPVPDPKAMAAVFAKRLLDKGTVNDPSKRYDSTPTAENVSISASQLVQLRTAILGVENSATASIAPTPSVLDIQLMPAVLASRLKSDDVPEAISMGHGFAIVIRRQQEQLAIYCADPEIGRVLIITAKVPSDAGWASFSLRLLQDDSTPYLIFQFRQGNKAVLDVSIFGGQQVTPLLRRAGVIQGQLTIGDLNLDGRKELLLSGAVDHVANDCNQCPAIRGSELYMPEGNPVQSFKFLGAFQSESESEVISASAGGIFAINSDVQYYNIRVARRLAEKGQTDPKGYEELRGQIFEFLWAANERSDAASGLLAASLAAPVVRMNSNVEKYANDPAVLALWNARLYLTAGDVAAAERVTRSLQQQFGNYIATEGPQRDDYRSLLIDIALARKRFSEVRTRLAEAEGQFDTGRQQAVYYLALGDTHESVIHLSDYVAQQVSKDPFRVPLGVPDAMVALARLVAQSGNVSEAEDYLFLAARWCRTTNFATCPSVFSAASELFPQKPDHDALLFFREGLANLGTDPSSAVIADGMLARYAQTDIGSEAGRVLSGIFQRFQSSEPDLAIRAALSLSSGHERAGDLHTALSWSSKALSVINSGLRRFVSLPEQLSYIDRDHQYDRHLHLLEVAHASVAEYLWAADKIKLRAFRDSVQQRSDAQEDTESSEPDALFAEIQERLTPDEAFVSYLFGHDAGYRMTVTHTMGAKVERINLSAAACGRLTNEVLSRFSLSDASNVVDIRSDRVSEKTRAALQGAGAKLFAFEMPPSVKSILISPDSCQAGLPWSALILEKGEYVGDRFSTAVVLPLRKKSTIGTARSALIIGAHAAPNWDPQAIVPVELRKLPPLRSSVTAVANALREANYQPVRVILDGYESNSKNAVSLAEQLKAMTVADFVYVSTHGTFDAADPGRSALVFNNGVFSHLLSADDLGALDLRRVRVLVLSACESGTLLQLPASEPVGFVRAAMAAGVGNGLFALWQVDDHATDNVFGAFYANLNSLSPADALRQAQLAERRERHHPYFWAGLSVVGRL